VTRTQHHDDERTRNTRLEGQYTFDRRGERSVLAFVTTYREELVEEFRAWRDAHPERSHADALRLWEVERFSERLYPSAHGAMAWAVRGVVPTKPGPGRLPYRDDD